MEKIKFMFSEDAWGSSAEKCFNELVENARKGGEYDQYLLNCILGE